MFTTDSGVRSSYYYYNVADLVDYIKSRSRSVKDINIDAIDFTPYANREKWMHTMTIHEFADSIGLTHSAILHRIKRLENFGVLKRETLYCPGTHNMYATEDFKRLNDNYYEILEQHSKRKLGCMNLPTSQPKGNRPKLHMFNTSLLTKRCRKCQYCKILSSSGNVMTCDYILIERHSRGCDPGDACTKYKPGRKKRKKVGLRLKGSL